MGDKSPDHRIKPFDELKISTTTVMVYSNVTFDDSHRQIFFRTTPVIYIDPPLTKKKKNIDKKKLSSPYGTIISLQYYPPPKDAACGVYFRGLRMSKKKSYWCSLCQLYGVNGKKIKSVIEDQCDVTQKNVGIYVTEEELRIYPPDTKKILFQCSNCNRYLNLSQLGKIVPFLNQITVVMSIGNIIINTMIFDSSFKISGNKSFDDAVETIRLLWEEYISVNKCNYILAKSKGNRSTDIHFLFETVMINVDFCLGFSIDKRKLNKLMQRLEFENIVFLSKYESTSVTHVNIKMYSTKPDDFTYDVLVYRNSVDLNPIFERTPDKWYSAKKTKKDEYTTLIVFSSSQSILTGRYPQNMKANYDFFVKLALEHKDEIIESVHKPTISIHEFLKQKQNEQK